MIPIPAVPLFAVLSNAPDLDCSEEYTIDDVKIGYWAYIGVSIFTTLLLSLFWLLRKEWFPLKERSPLLVWCSMIGNLLIQVSFPAVFLYQGSENVADGFLKYLIMAFIHFGNLCLFIPYVWRALRLHYAFNIDHRNKRMEGIYSRQYVMFFITVAVALAYGLLMIVFFKENSLPFYEKTSASLTTFTVTTGIYFVEMCLMALTAYMLRHVKDEYNFNKELIFVVFTVFVTFNFTAYFYSSTRGCNSVIAFPTTMMIINLRGWLIMLVTAVKPLFRATKLHYLLAQKFVIDIFQNFLGDETCIKAFDAFIREGRNREGTFLHESAPFPPNDEIELFRVFILLRERIISEYSSRRIITSMMNEFIYNKKVADLFPETYIYEIKQLYENDADTMTVESFDKLHGFCIYYFQAVFENRFRKTKSFQYIKEQFGKNEQINRRLHKLKLISIR